MDRFDLIDSKYAVQKNPYYYEGTVLHGIGSPHTAPHCVWPISLVLQALTTDDQDEIEAILSMLLASHDQTFYMHESIHVDDPHTYSRSWSAWANSIFSELILKYAGFEI